MDEIRIWRIPGASPRHLPTFAVMRRYFAIISCTALLSPFQHAAGGQDSSNEFFVPQAPRSVQWNLRVGATYRNLGNIEFDSGSYSSLFGPSFIPLPGFGPPAIGSANEFADRIYSDGFVFMDAATDNPNSFRPWTITENWLFSAFGRYDWSDSLSGSVGSSSFSVDLSGYTLGGAFTFAF